MYYKLQSQGLAPKTYAIGASRRISPEADADWLRQREKESARAGMTKCKSEPA